MIKQQVDYQQYLASREWRVKRKKFIDDATYGVCERCAIRSIEDVHHLTYANIGNEDYADLLGVCRPCHEYLAGKRERDPALDPIIDAIAQGLFPVKEWEWDPVQTVFVGGESNSGLTLRVYLVSKDQERNHKPWLPRMEIGLGVIAIFSWEER